MKIKVKRLNRFGKNGYGIYKDDTLVDTAFDLERAKRYAVNVAEIERQCMKPYSPFM